MSKDFEHFKKVYPSCSNKEIRNLVNAIKGNKYWKVLPKLRNLIYVVALTRAKYSSKDGKLATATYLKRVVVDNEVARFCRKGRILMVILEGEEKGKAIWVLTYPAFLELMRDEEKVKNLLKELKPMFITAKRLKACQTP
jgi:hypothetical protein